MNANAQNENEDEHTRAALRSTPVSLLLTSVYIHEEVPTARKPPNKKRLEITSSWRRRGIVSVLGNDADPAHRGDVTTVQLEILSDK